MEVLGSGNTYVDVQREGVVLLVVGGEGGGVVEVVDVVEVVGGRRSARRSRARA